MAISGGSTSAVQLVELTRDQRKILGATKKSVVGSRMAHGDYKAFATQIPDSEGRPGAPLMRLSALAIMEKHNTISRQLRNIGDLVHDQFRLACLDGLKAAAVDRVPGPVSFWREPGGNDRARRRIAEVLKLLGSDNNSLAASCAWDVLGLEASLRDWAAKRVGGNTHRATGVLVATLSVMEGPIAAWS